jgi:hypothetical protein
MPSDGMKSVDRLFSEMFHVRVCGPRQTQLQREEANRLEEVWSKELRYWWLYNSQFLSLSSPRTAGALLSPSSLLFLHDLGVLQPGSVECKMHRHQTIPEHSPALEL